MILRAFLARFFLEYERFLPSWRLSSSRSSRHTTNKFITNLVCPRKLLTLVRLRSSPYPVVNCYRWSCPLTPCQKHGAMEPWYNWKRQFKARAPTPVSNRRKKKIECVTRNLPAHKLTTRGIHTVLSVSNWLSCMVGNWKKVSFFHTYSTSSSFHYHPLTGSPLLKTCPVKFIATTCIFHQRHRRQCCNQSTIPFTDSTGNSSSWWTMPTRSTHVSTYTYTC